MDSAEIEVFLTLAEELHFSRTAERLYLPQSRVSRLVASLERKVGGALFERTSRRVTLTPLGQQLADRLGPAYAEVNAALGEARDSARHIEGSLRLGCPIVVGGPALSLLLERFATRHPDCEVTLHDQLLMDPYGPLRRGDVDVLVNWLAVDEPDLTAGPAIEHRDRVVVVGLGHRLAGRKSVSVEELAAEETHGNEAGIPAALFDAIIPPSTPSGRPIPRTYPLRSSEDSTAAISKGLIVHLSAADVPIYQRSDLQVIPVPDLPPLPLGLIWCTAHENARIRALAAVARETKTPSASR
ncbi:MAG: LysR family transcriptional regulator [Streptosporangiaceae bacterium]|nr:LysR family transcriptional regulator [Streptosporangiaceae bacterium]